MFKDVKNTQKKKIMKLIFYFLSFFVEDKTKSQFIENYERN